MDGRPTWTEPTWTDCDEAGDYVLLNVLSPRDLLFRPDNMDETVPHTFKSNSFSVSTILGQYRHYLTECQDREIILTQC